MSQSLLARMACGATLIAVIACGESPTASTPTANRHNVDASSALAGFSLAPNLAGGESVLRRSIVLADGRQFTVEGVRGADGLPRDLQLSQSGVVVARLRNEWRAMGGTAVLERQQVVRYQQGEVVAAFDTRASGGVESVAGVPIAIPAAMRDAGGGTRAFSRKVPTFSEFGDYFSSGPCDALARAVEGALDSWLTSCIGMAVGTATGNPLIAYSAFAVQLKAYRDVMRAEAALDDCVANAGKPDLW